MSPTEDNLITVNKITRQRERTALKHKARTEQPTGRQELAAVWSGARCSLYNHSNKGTICCAAVVLVMPGPGLVRLSGPPERSTDELRLSGLGR